MPSTKAAVLAVVCGSVSLDLAAAFCPSASSTAVPGLRRAALSAPRYNLASLRCSNNDNKEGSPQFVKLETTKTSWQGWGTQTQKREEKKIEVDASNPSAAVQQALDAARNNEDIAKYLGTTESKQRAGITGDVELASFDNGKLILRLTGNFWHNRQMVFSETAEFMKKVLPNDMITSVEIEDESQLQGFAETSRHFENQEKLTEEDLRNREAKGKNIYGEALENPFAKFRRKKLEDQAKFDEEMQRRRQLDSVEQGAQLETILSETNTNKLLKNEEYDVLDPLPDSEDDEDLRPEDILNRML